jgi:hypothetical protein
MSRSTRPSTSATRRFNFFLPTMSLLPSTRCRRTRSNIGATCDSYTRVVLAVIIGATILASCSSTKTATPPATTSTTMTATTAAPPPYTVTNLNADGRTLDVTVATVDQAQLEQILTTVAAGYATLDSVTIDFHCNGGAATVAVGTAAHTAKGGAQTGTRQGDQVVTVEPGASC